MYINSIQLLSYEQINDQLVLVLATSSLDEARNCIASTIVVQTGDGLQVNLFSGYTTVQRLSLDEATQHVTVVAQRSISVEQLLATTKEALEAENKQLTAKLDASIQSNQMLEDCLVEMAEIVYA